MRLALGFEPDPADFMTSLCTLPLMPLASAGFGGASLSATRISPFGSTYTQRGCSRPRATGATLRPGAGCGMASPTHGFACAMFVVGISFLLGSGKTGEGPYSPAVDSSDTCAAASTPPAAKARHNP